ncbi:FAD-dependent oxidoreductase [Ruminococcaceae bacterium OttesenSCG-928-A16]|nr:FAD-dependent oxidoreductase [Ruminococcaceae bacterium OttesenSCG-928-A16]
MKIVIVGGVAGGASAAARLRRLDEQAEVVLLERGPYISYANCGLPYYIGGEITDKEELTLQTPESFTERFAVDVRAQSEVIAINPEDKTVDIKNLATGKVYTESYDKLLLSPGAEPIVPNLPGVEDKRIFTLRNIPDTYRIYDYIKQHNPRTALVVGGGYIGLEMAENLAHAGLSVTVAEFANHVIAPLDYDMACEVHRKLRKQGVTLLLNNKVCSFTPQASGLAVALDNGQLEADMVLLSVGVQPENALAKTAGLALSPRGAIVVDETLRTSNPHIYAVGDAIQVKNPISGQAAYIPLAGPANKQGRIAAKNMLGGTEKYKGTIGASVLKLFDTTIATTGLNETAAKQAGIDYDKIYLASPSHATYYPGAETMSIKVLFENKTGRILGGQIIGKGGVDKRIDVLSTAIYYGGTAADLANTELSYAPPYSSAKDPMNMAGFAIENLLEGLVHQYHWHDIETLAQDKDFQFIDARTPAEYARGHIGNAKNIPVDELRERLGELDKTKPVYLYCLSGQRSYLATRILLQNGFTCSHLAGGYRLYSSVMLDKTSPAQCPTCTTPLT